MARIFATLLMALQVGAGFGAASAELISTTSNAMEIELRVEVRESAGSVVAHLAFGEEQVLVIPLVQREAGVFGIRTEVKRVNYQVVFELIGEEGGRSDPHSLVDLGLEFPQPEAVETTTTEVPGLSEDTAKWGWLGLALGAAALSALAFWALGGDDPDQDSSETGSEEVIEGLPDH